MSTGFIINAPSMQFDALIDCACVNMYVCMHVFLIVSGLTCLHVWMVFRVAARSGVCVCVYKLYVSLFICQLDGDNASTSVMSVYGDFGHPILYYIHLYFHTFSVEKSMQVWKLHYRQVKTLIMVRGDHSCFRQAPLVLSTFPFRCRALTGAEIQ